MTFKSVMKLSVISLLCTSLTAFALTDVPCPTIDNVKAAAKEINTVSKMQGMFMAWSANYAINTSGHSWIVMAYTPLAKDFNGSFSSGVSSVKNTSIQRDQSAIEMQGALICRYSDTSFSNVMAIAVNGQEDKPIQITKLDANIFKATRDLR